MSVGARQDGGAGKGGGDLQPGAKLGKYEILRHLATGGMAEIFIARVSGLPGFQKIVVLKRIMPQLAANREFVDMFLDEARVSATMQHPNVVQTYDVGAVDGNYFMAMEYLHGEDIRSILKLSLKTGQKVPLEHALNIIIGVCNGLHYAHELIGFDGKPLNIIHRDVTPQNVIVTYDGGVKLLDFGVAKAANSMGETRFGALKGKVPYMSPEQCRSEVLDRRSDIFALGILLYELTLCRRLYKGESDFEILKQIVEGTIEPPHEIQPGYNFKLEGIVMRALEKDKNQRYQTAREMQSDLEALVREERLVVSSIALQQYMEALFGKKIEKWREAQAQGKSLAEHLQSLPSSEFSQPSLASMAAMSPEAAEAQRKKTAENDALIASLEDSTRATNSVPVMAPSGVPAATQLAQTSPTASTEPTAKKGGAGIWLGLGALVIVGGIGAAIVLKGQKPAPIEKPPIAETEKAKEPEKKEVAPTEFGVAKLVTTPPGADVYVNGKKLPAVSPTTIDQIPVGKEQTLVVMLKGYKDAESKFTVTNGGIQTVAVTLEKDPTAKIADAKGSKMGSTGATGTGATGSSGKSAKELGSNIANLALGGSSTGTPLPAVPELKSLVQKTLVKFGEALKTQDFAAFHGDLSKLWKSQMSLQQCKDHFSKLATTQADLSTLSPSGVSFKKAPRISPNDELELVGVAVSGKATVKFDTSYVLEGGAWKLAGLGVSITNKVRVGSDQDNGAPAAPADTAPGPSQ